MKEKARELLRYLGSNSTYIGYHQIVIASELIEKDETLLLRVTIDLYPRIAKICSCTVTSVERNIRNLIHRAWHQYPERLEQIMRGDLQYPPTNSEFLDSFVTYIQREMYAKK